MWALIESSLPPATLKKLRASFSCCPMSHHCHQYCDPRQVLLRNLFRRFQKKNQLARWTASWQVLIFNSCWPTTRGTDQNSSPVHLVPNGCWWYMVWWWYQCKVANPDDAESRIEMWHLSPIATTNLLPSLELLLPIIWHAAICLCKISCVDTETRTILT